MILRVGTTADYPPFTELDPRTQTLTGFDITLLSQFAKAHEIQLDFVQTYWQTLEIDLLKQAFDMAIGGIHYTPRRAELFLTSNSIMTDHKVMLTHQDYLSRLTNKTLDDLNQPEYRVIFNPGGTNEAFVVNYLEKATHIVEPQSETLFLRLINQEADFMITDEVEAIYRQQLFKHELRALYTDQPFAKTSMVYLFHQSQQALCQQFNAWLSI